MLLAFDVGNTNIVLGVFKDGEMITNWRLETDNRKSADEYGMIINQLFQYENLDFSEVEDVIIATVHTLHAAAPLAEVFQYESDRHRTGNQDRPDRQIR